MAGGREWNYGFLRQLKIGDCNFLRDDAYLRHLESEYAIPVATKKIASCRYLFGFLVPGGYVNNSMT